MRLQRSGNEEYTRECCKLPEKLISDIWYRHNTLFYDSRRWLVCIVREKRKNRAER
jgi:hypothetical protein